MSDFATDKVTPFAGLASALWLGNQIRRQGQRQNQFPLQLRCPLGFTRPLGLPHLPLSLSPNRSVFEINSRFDNSDSTTRAFERTPLQFKSRKKRPMCLGVTLVMFAIVPAYETYETYGNPFQLPLSLTHQLTLLCHPPLLFQGKL